LKAGRLPNVTQRAVTKFNVLANGRQTRPLESVVGVTWLIFLQYWTPPISALGEG